MKLIWFIIIIIFISYGFYDIYKSLSEILQINSLRFDKVIAKLAVPLYVIGCSLYLFWIKLMNK